MRTTARETLFKLTFAKQFVGEYDSNLEKALFKADNLDEDDKAYCKDILKIIEEHEDEFVKIIDERSYSYPEKGLFPADRSVLFIALAEILYYDSVPDAVAVNEAADIAAKYSSEKSATFVSGILGEVIRGEKR